MMSCNCRTIEVIEPSGIHLGPTTFQTRIPAPGSKDLVTLHILCNDNARFRLCLLHIRDPSQCVEWSIL